MEERRKKRMDPAGDVQPEGEGPSMRTRRQQQQKRKRVIRSDGGEDSDIQEVFPPRKDASLPRKKTQTRMKTTPVDG